MIIAISDSASDKSSYQDMMMGGGGLPVENSLRFSHCLQKNLQRQRMGRHG
jgi:hypothetical protein